MEPEREPVGSFAYAKAYFGHKERLLSILTRVVDSGLVGKKRTFTSGTIIVHEGDRNKKLFIITGGYTVVLRKGSNVVSGTLSAGSFAGLVSFITGEEAFATVQAATDVTAIELSADEVDHVANLHKRFRLAFQQLVVANLVERYQANLDLSVELNDTAQELQKERDELQKAYAELESAHQRLVQQEKMATLGQLVAGVAHELNNPIGALLQSNLELGSLAARIADQPDAHKLLEAGLQSDFFDTAKLRERMQLLEKSFQIGDRTMQRRFAILPDHLLSVEIFSKIQQNDALLAFFEMGRIIKQISVISDRVSNMVKSLKSYSRQDSDQVDEADLNEGIQNTVMILGNRIKRRQMELDLGVLPVVTVHTAELNQVWTNLLVNACDASPEGGMLKISSRLSGEMIELLFEDNGPGVPEALRERIFETNFTTKSNPSNFGLGLGLAISKSVIEKHGGSILVDRSPVLGGARFIVKIPLITTIHKREGQ